MAMTLTPYGGIAGLLLVDGVSHGDDRGFFMESFRVDDWTRAGLPALLQDNLSRSRRGTIRGLHYQKNPHPVGKLVRCVRGRIFDVAVDIRQGSPTYGRSATIELCDKDNRMFWVPPGFAHGFCALSAEADVAYKVTDYWTASVDGGILWNDPALAIGWPLPEDQILVSPKDAKLPRLADADHDFVWNP